MRVSAWLHRSLAVVLMLGLVVPAGAFEEAIDCPPGDPCYDVIHMHDDISPIMFQFLHDQGSQIFLDGKDPKDPTSAAPSVDTPNVTRLAAAGVAILGAIGEPFCSATRASIITGRLPEHRYNRTAGVRRPDAEWSWYQTDPSRPNWIKVLRDAGIPAFFTGKWHQQHAMIFNPAYLTTAVKLAGFTYGEAIRLGNDTNTWNPISEPDVYVDYDVTATGFVWEDCNGHKFSPMIDIDGNWSFDSQHSGAASHAAAEAFMADPARIAAGGAYIVVVWCNINHEPIDTGHTADVEDPLECPGYPSGLISQNDWPPDDSFTAGDLEVDLWLSQLRWEDLQIGATLDAAYFDIGGNDVYCNLVDNGSSTPISNDTVPGECGNKSKGSEHPCGTDSALVCAGRGISQGVMPFDQMMHVADIGATMLAAHGLNDPHPGSSRSFWDCMTETNGETHENCSAARPNLPSNLFTPVGSTTHVDGSFPDVNNDGAGKWNALSPADRIVYNGVRYMLRQQYDQADMLINFQPYRCREELWQYTEEPGNATRYGNGGSSLLAMTTLEAGCAIDLFDSADWTDPPAVDSLAVIPIMRANILNQGKDDPASFGGGGM